VTEKAIFEMGFPFGRETLERKGGRERSGEGEGLRGEMALGREDGGRRGERGI